MAFAHLHVHTEYSLLDGSNKIKEYVKRVKELGMTHAAITDHGTMYGCVAFYEEAKKQGIVPIIGCEVYVAPGSRFNRETSDNKYYHLVLLCENDLGYHNLMRLVSIGFKEGYYYKPRVDKEVLRQYHEGLICLSGCLQGEVAVYLNHGLYDEAKKAALEYIDIFGKDNYFLEIQNHNIEDQLKINPEIYRLSKDIDIPLVATNDVHYTYASDADAHDLLLCLQTGKTVNDEDRMKYAYGQFFVRSESEMRELFPYAPEAIDNTMIVAERCNVTMPGKEPKLPHFEVPDGFDSQSYLRYRCEEGLKKRYPDNNPVARERLDYELSVIEKMGFVDYFLIVMDFIEYAKDHGISVGPGRGSAAGSIVAYCLRITNIDPIRFNLFFERFLNPERVTMPDIDIDFGDERRQEVIDYVVNKYGAEKVSRIITFGTLKAKGVVRDVARVMALPYEIGDRISKAIPNRINGEEVNLVNALKVSPDLRKMYETDSNVKKIIEMSMKLEHLPRHSSVHPAGVLIAPKEVEAYVPLSQGSDNIVVTQYEAPILEEQGLLKMDFLSLKTLTVLEKACLNVKKSRGIDINLEEIDMDDIKVYDYIGTGNTEGVFQLESGGMRGFMKKLKPKNLENVMAGIALYRPGPMQYIDTYIKYKENPEQAQYLCKELKPILETTYGCIVYQEQVMQIVRDLAGFTMGGSDKVRKIMSKKKAAEMEEQGRYFIYGNEEKGIDGCVKRGIPEKVAIQIYGEMKTFAEYAFNKSHSAVYAVISYQTAYMKYYYPVEYMAALITCFLDNPVKTAEYISVAREMGIEVLPPDINAGMNDFTVKDNKLIYSLKAIKNVGGPVIDKIVAEREANGPFESISDFVRRMGTKEINKRAVENFIKAGAFDSLGGNRRQFLQVYEKIMDDYSAENKKTDSNQMTIFDMIPHEEKKLMENVKLPNLEEFPKDVVLQMERDVLGVYVSGHPLDDVMDIWKKNVSAFASDFAYQVELEGSRIEDKKKVTIGGIISNLNVRLTKKKETMAIFELEDLTGSVEAMVFPKAYDRVKEMLNPDKPVFVTGRVSTEDEADSKIIVEEVIFFDDLPKNLWLKFDDMDKYNELWTSVHEVLKRHRGIDNVNIRVIKENKLKTLTKHELGVCADENIIKEIEAILGEKTAVIR